MASSNNKGTGSAGLREASNAVAKILDLIMKKIPVCTPQAPGLDLPVPESKTQIAGECRDCGRCMAKLCQSLPFDVDIGQISRSAFENSMRKLSGCKDLRNILLLITPLEVSNKEAAGHKIHCYRLDTRKHLGVTTVTTKHLHQIERCHRTDSYTIVHCTRHIEQEDAVRNTPIKGQIFKVVEEASKAVRSTWYKGNPVRIFYKGCGARGKRDGGNPYLQQPRNPIRMPRRQYGGLKQSPSLLQRSLALTKVDQKQQRGQQRGQKRLTPQRINRQKPTQLANRNDLKRNPLTDLNRQKKSNLATLQEQRKKLLAKANECRKMFEHLQELKVGLQKCQLNLLGVEQVENLIFFDYDNIFGHPMGPRCPLQDPPLLPLKFSNAAFCFLEKKLRWPSACETFLKLQRLVLQINQRQRPRLEHLMRFFLLAEYLQFKLYIRREIVSSGLPPTSRVKRLTIDAFVFHDRREYIATIGLLETQLHALARCFPGARHNFRFVDNAFDLTPVPEKVCNWLAVTMDAFNRRRWYKYLGELALDRLRPQMGVFDLPEDMEEDYEF